MKINKKIAVSSIAALMAISPVLSLASNTTRTVQAASKTFQGANALLLTHNAYVYSINAKRLSTYQGSKKPVLIKGAVIDYPDPGTVTNKGRKYYYLGDKGYIKAGNAKPIVQQIEPGTLKLNYNTYVYDKNGKRLKSYRGSKKNTHLYKWHSVKYTGTLQPITNDSKQYYCLNDDNYSQSWLPYQTIKGNQYYSIGAGGYVKAANVDQIDGKKLYTNEATVKVADKKLPNDVKKYEKNQKITVDGITTRFDDPMWQTLYHIKGAADVLVNKNGIVSGLPRQPLKAYSEHSHVAFVRDSDVYDINGNVLPYKSQTINGEKATSAFNTHDVNVPVDESLYIWVPSENKAELFYRLMGISTLNNGYYGNDYEEMMNNLDYTKVTSLKYIKAADVKYASGPRITKAENTAADAQADIKVASSADKQALQKLIDQEQTVEASEPYANVDESYGNRDAYKNALKVAKTINSSDKSTIAEVKEATRLLNMTQENLLNKKK